MSYHQHTETERYQIYSLIKAGLSITAIRSVLKRTGKLKEEPES